MSVYKQMYGLECSALALDFDGTIADTVGAHTQARQDALAEMSRLTGDHRFIDISPELQAEAHRHGARVVALKNELYWQHAERGLEPIEGAIPFVEWASDRYAGRVALVTTASLPREVEPFLEANQIQDSFHIVIAREDVPASQLKPHPQAYRLALHYLDRSPADVVAVEDTPRGIQAAQAAGIVTVGITTTHTAEQLSDGSHTMQIPDRIVKSFKELKELL
jgi:HAD superfamily hydrolase (TIGR01509 family)